MRIIIIRHGVSALHLKQLLKQHKSKAIFLTNTSHEIKKFHHITSLIIEWLDIFISNIPEVFTN